MCLKKWQIQENCGKSFKNGVYEVCLSTVTLQEIDDCSEPKKSNLWEYLNQIVYETYDVTKEALDVAHQIVAMGVLTKRVLTTANISVLL
jgi:hypothetical protein